MDTPHKAADILRRIYSYRCVECSHASCKKPQMEMVSSAITRLKSIAMRSPSNADSLPKLMQDMQAVRPCHELPGYVPPHAIRLVK